MRNILLEKSYTKCCGETILRHFYQKSKFESCIQFVFIECQIEDYRNILKLSCRALAFASCRAFLKNKEVWN